MKKITRWIVKKFIKNSEFINNPYVRSEYGILEGFVSLLINIALFIVKMMIGYSLKSMALIADAFHTLSDSITSGVVILGFLIARKPSDKEHPFGHGQIEPIATLVVSILLFIVGFELAKSSFVKIQSPETRQASWAIVGIIFVTIILKELLSQFSFELGKMIDSDVLKADALHHRSDAISTVLVIVAMVGARYHVLWLDGLMGFVVSLCICYFAYKIAQDAINPLLGEPPSEELLIAIEKIAMNFDGVHGVHDIIVNQYGQTKIISLHLEVSDKENVNILHALSEKVEEEIAARMEAVVVAHIDPINREHPRYQEFYDFISKIVSDSVRIKNFHELRIVGVSSEKCTLVFDVALQEDVPDKEKFKAVKEILQRFKDVYPLVKINVKVEQRFVYSLNK